MGNSDRTKICAKNEDLDLLKIERKEKTKLSFMELIVDVFYARTLNLLNCPPENDNLGRLLCFSTGLPESSPSALPILVFD